MKRQFLSMILYAGALAPAFLMPKEARAEKSIPALSGPVIDEARMLSRDETRKLEQQIRDMMPAVQAQVWIISSLEGDVIESLSIRAVEKWKLGTAEADNGILVLVAKEDRQMRIEVGQGLEGNIPDVLAARIIDRIMTPRFREGQFYSGIRDAIQTIEELASGTAGQELKKRLSEAPRRRNNLDMFQIILLLIFFPGILILRLIMGLFGIRTNRSSTWSGGWGGGGFGGGGFGGGGGWSGGGGGFSGGGSSGRW